MQFEHEKLLMFFFFFLFLFLFLSSFSFFFKSLCFQYLYGKMQIQVSLFQAPSIPYKKIWSTTLKHFTKEILLETLNDNKLSAKSELEVLDVLSWWLKIQNENKTPCRETTELLQCIRWSAVESNLIEALRERTILAESREFLNKVLEYRASNNQFQGLKTLLRPSTREELFLCSLYTRTRRTLVITSFTKPIYANRIASN